MHRVLRLVAAALLLGLAAAACTIEPSDLDETEEQYLERIEEVVRPMRQSTADFRRIFQDTEARSVFNEQVQQVQASQRMVDAFRELDDITPPPRFAADQRLLMRTIAEVVPVLRTARQLARQEEFVQSATRNAHATVLYQRSLLEYSGRFCLVAATSASERDLCAPIRILPGGVYGERLHSLLARASAEFTPRGFSFVPRIWDSPEVARYLQSIGPSLVDGVRTARDGIRELVPPDEFAADHRVLEEYFNDITRISQQIAAAARDDPGRLRRLFPESQRVVDRARERLSESIRPAVKVWFFPSSDD